MLPDANKAADLVKCFKLIDVKLDVLCATVHSLYGSCTRWTIIRYVKYNGAIKC